MSLFFDILLLDIRRQMPCLDYIDIFADVELHKAHCHMVPILFQTTFWFHVYHLIMGVTHTCSHATFDMHAVKSAITKTYLYNFDPLKPHFYMVKLGFTGVYIIFLLFLLKNIDCGYLLEPPRRGGFNEYPQSMF